MGQSMQGLGGDRREFLGTAGDWCGQRREEKGERRKGRRHRVPWILSPWRFSSPFKPWSFPLIYSDGSPGRVLSRKVT